MYELYILLGRGLILPLFSVFLSRVLLEYAYFLWVFFFASNVESNWNMHISRVLFASSGSPMYKSLTKTKHTQSLKHMKY